MPHIIDEDVIRQGAVSKEYRDNWDRVFGEKSEEIEGPPAPCDGTYDDGVMPTTCENREGCGRTGCPEVRIGYMMARPEHIQSWDSYMKAQHPVPPTPEEVIAACEGHPTMRHKSKIGSTFTFEVTLTSAEIDALADALDILNDSDAAYWPGSSDQKERAEAALHRIVFVK